MTTTLTQATSEVVLADGTLHDLAGMDGRELATLQWQQERQFAEQIMAAPKRSPQRAEAIRHAYDTVPLIYSHVLGQVSEPLVMGMHPRQVRLVHDLLDRQQARGLAPRFFEIGYAGGVLLNHVLDWGYPVAGIEVSPLLREQATALLGEDVAGQLLLGDLVDQPIEGDDRCTLVYWNDVFEHIPPDEILDYLKAIRARLVPGGQLITITPNWHVRPNDVTGDFCPPRTTAAGLHLKEYTLREVTRLLRQAGFERVSTPLCVVPSRILQWGDGLGHLKRLLEPCLEWMPFSLARLLCRGLALSYTIATRLE